VVTDSVTTSNTLKMEKKFTHNKIERCRLTQKSIDTDKEKWVAVISYDKKKEVEKVFYKHDFFFDYLKGNNELIKKELMEKTMITAGTMLRQVFPGRPVYEI